MTQPNRNNLHRRAAMQQFAALGAVGAAAASAADAPAPTSAARPDAIREENARPGTREWLLDRVQIDPASRYRSPWIEGYCSQRSVRAGQSIQFHVSTHPASPFTIDIYRMGFYGGAGGRLMKRLGEFPGKQQRDPEIGPKRVRACDWPAATALRIPDDWLSGVYLGKLTSLAEGLQSYVIFIVRDDRPADFLFQCSDNTWQAYNRWPNQFALYDNGKHEWYWGGNVQVSFRRPYGKYCQIVEAPLSLGSGEWFLWEYPLAFWMEERGMDVSYISNDDTHRDAAGLLRAKGFLSVGHDEYWTIQMFQNVRAAVEKGVSAAFFSGNAVCGRIEFDESGTALERVGVFGPPGGTFEFEQMKTLAHERPYANELMGAHSTGPVTGGADWICTDPGHWIYRDTGMKQGEAIPGVIGWEWHGDPAPIPGLAVVAQGPTQSAPGKPNGGTYTATVYPGPRKNFVFNAATCWWADGLAAPPGYVRPKVYTAPQGPDRRLQQITQDVLDRIRTG